MGALPTTGSGNIHATYRVGSGLAGRVPERSLTTLLVKPKGLSEAVNPLAAEGGADAESLENARDNAPRTVRTFGRAISLEDFEDLVTESGEVAKVHATWVWDGLDRAIHLTVASQAGGRFSDDALRDLGTSLSSARDTNHRLLIDNFSRVYVRLEAGVGVDRDYDRDAVLDAVHAAVVEALSFAEQDLGRSLHLSDFYQVIQDVEGVKFADIDVFQFRRPTAMTLVQFLLFVLRRGGTFADVQGHLRVFSARPDPNAAGKVLPAELASVLAASDDVLITPREG
jgi:predicted phage baseplate assembly protein